MASSLFVGIAEFIAPTAPAKRWLDGDMDQRPRLEPNHQAAAQAKKSWFVSSSGT